MEARKVAVGLQVLLPQLGALDEVMKGANHRRHLGDVVFIP
jgi:hypothetical protein